MSIRRLLSFMLSQPSAVVSHHNSYLPPRGPHYHPTIRDIATTGAPGVVIMAIRQPGEDESATTWGWRVLQHGKRGKSETGPDGVELQGMQRPQSEEGIGRDGADEATNDIYKVAPRGSEGERGGAEMSNSCPAKGGCDHQEVEDKGG